jgi:hypothetical protein
VRRSLSSEQWRAIEKALPPDIDRARVRSELERVADLRAGRSPDQVRVLRKLLNDLEPASQLLGFGQVDDLKQACADALRRPRLFNLQCGIIRAFHKAGGDLAIATPGPPAGESVWPKPTGAVIDYFDAASIAILGKSPGASRIKQIVQVYRRLIFLEGAGGMTVRADLFDIDGRPVVDDKDRAAAAASIEGAGSGSDDMAMAGLTEVCLPIAREVEQ